MIQTAQLVAHRGYPERYPGNSLPGIQAAVDAGALWLEWDVQLSSDRAPIIFHDSSLKTDGQLFGDVRKMTVDRLGRIQIGQLADHTPVYIPKLQQGLELLVEQERVSVFVEIKTESIDAFGRKVVMDAILPLMKILGHRAILISFDWQILKLARDCESVAIGWVIDRPDFDAQRTAQDLEADFLFLDQKKLGPAITPLWAGNWRWVAYATDRLTQANSLIEQGFELVETNDIGGMIKALANG